MKLRKPTPADKTFYYATYKDKIEEFVLDQTEKRGNIIYGSQAVRARLPSAYMTRKPHDWDVHSKNPKRDAQDMVRKLNEYYGCDMFYVLHKTQYDPAGKRIDIYAVKNRTITPGFVKDNTYTPAIRYSPKAEERREIRQYKDLTEIDYTALDHPERYEEVPVFGTHKPDVVGKVKVRPIETVYRHRKRMLAQDKAPWRRQKDLSMLGDIDRYEKHEKLKKELRANKVPVLTIKGKRKFVPKFIKFGGKE